MSASVSGLHEKEGVGARSIRTKGIIFEVCLSHFARECDTVECHARHAIFRRHNVVVAAVAAVGGH